MNTKKNYSQIVIKRIYLFLAVAVLMYLILGEYLLDPDGLNKGAVCDIYRGQWEQVASDGSRIPVKVPGKFEADRNEVITIETTLPKAVSENRFLCFRSARQDMKFYVDGELRQVYSTEKSRLFGKSSAVAYVFFEITEEDEGKSLCVETRTDSSYSGLIYPVYYGNQFGIWRHFFYQFGAELIVAFIMLILSVVATIASIILRLRYQRKVALLYLGVGIVFAAFWLITNSAFRQLIFPNLSVVTDITFFLVLLLPFPYLVYMDEIQEGRYHKIYKYMEIIDIIDFFVLTALHIFNIYDFSDTILIMSVFCVLSILIILITVVMDLRKKFLKKYVYVAIGMLGACIFAFFQILFYFQRSSTFSGVSLALGLIILLFFATISTIHNLLEIEQEKKSALMASEAKGRFLANMSHEIRTPINTVLGMDAMILRESREPHIREYAMDIHTSGQALLSLINDILDFSKIESGKLDLLPVEYDFSSLIHDIMNMIRMKAQDKELEVRLNLDPQIPSRLFGDDVRIRQILINLLNNAVKYTEEGEVSLDVHGTVKENDEVALHFCVADTGIGIREEDIPKLFEEFERIEETRNRKIEGTGLGMSITVHLLAMMGSELQVKSEYGKGSSFSFTLHQKIMDSEPIGSLSERIRENATNYSYNTMLVAPDARVLVVDDNLMNRKVFIKLLKETRIMVDEAAGGEECLEMVCENKYDLIFLDHMMPGMDGIEVLHEIMAKENNPNRSIPIIALTANAVTGAREMYLSEGFRDFLSKPISSEKLEKMLIKYLPENKVMAEVESSEQCTQEVELPELEGIDWQYAERYCKNTQYLLDTIVQFYDTMDLEADQLEQYLHQIDEEEMMKHFQVKVHAMKSTSAMIGAIYLSSVARMLEFAARDGRRDRIKDITPAFLEEWANMKDILRPFVEEIHSGEDETRKPPADYSMTREYLRLLRTAMDDMEVDMADEIIAQIRRFEYAEQAVSNAMDELGIAVTNLDSERVNILVAEIENMIDK